MSAVSCGRVVSKVRVRGAANARAGLPAPATMSHRKCLCCNAVGLGAAPLPAGPDLTDAQSLQLLPLHLLGTRVAGRKRSGQLYAHLNLIDVTRGPEMGQKPPPRAAVRQVYDRIA